MPCLFEEQGQLSLPGSVKDHLSLVYWQQVRCLPIINDEGGVAHVSQELYGPQDSLAFTMPFFYSRPFLLKEKFPLSPADISFSGMTGHWSISQCYFTEATQISLQYPKKCTELLRCHAGNGEATTDMTWSPVDTWIQALIHFPFPSVKHHSKWQIGFHSVNSNPHLVSRTKEERK